MTDHLPPMDFAGQTDVGLKRSKNEDSFRIMVPPPNAPQEPQGALFIVADGMGGMGGGDVASKAACEEIIRRYYSPALSQADLVNRVESALDSASDVVREQAQLIGLPRIGATAAVLAILPDRTAAIFNVGDARAYRIRGNRIEQLSRDQSVLADQIEMGLISEEEAKNRKNVNVTAYVGQPMPLTANVHADRLEDGDIYILCSDGLWDVVPADEFMPIVQQLPARQAAAKLIKLVRQRGAPDNVTVVIMRNGPPPKYRAFPVPLAGVAVVGVALVAVAALALLASGGDGSEPPTSTVSAVMLITNTPEESPVVSINLATATGVAVAIAPGETDVVASDEPANEATDQPTGEATGDLNVQPLVNPSAEPRLEPTATATELSAGEPTQASSQEPTEEPTEEPSPVVPTSPPPTATAAPPTATQEPLTSTPVTPTVTLVQPSATNTLVPPTVTFTPTNTSTNTSTDTPTDTPTPTPVPPTLTLAVSATPNATRVALVLSQTALANLVASNNQEMTERAAPDSSATATDQPATEPASPTPTPTAAPTDAPTSTPAITPVPTATPSPRPTVTVAPTENATATLTSSPTATKVEEPTVTLNPALATSEPTPTVLATADPSALTRGELLLLLATQEGVALSGVTRLYTLPDEFDMATPAPEGSLPPGTQVMRLNENERIFSDGALRLIEVRILDGPEQGGTGWIQRTAVEKAQPLSPRIFVNPSNESGVNLRRGDSIVFDIIGGLRPGESARVLGVSRASQWFYVETLAGRRGWVSPSFVTVEGDASQIDQLASPATPTPPPTATFALPISATDFEFGPDPAQ